MSDTAEVSTQAPRTLHKGVYETSWGGRYFAQIYRNGKRHYLGTYATPEGAAEAYQKAEELLG